MGGRRAATRIFEDVWKVLRSAIMPAIHPLLWGCKTRMSRSEIRRSRAVSILGDVHFWVPTIVLLGGLLLLRFLH